MCHIHIRKTWGVVFGCLWDLRKDLETSLFQKQGAIFMKTVFCFVYYLSQVFLIIIIKINYIQALAVYMK